MRTNKGTSCVHLQRNSSPGLDVLTLDRRSYKEYFITVTPHGDEPFQELFERAGRVIQERNAQVISQEVFGLSDAGGKGTKTLKKSVGSLDAPVTWIEDGHEHEQNLFGCHLWAVSGRTLTPLMVGKKVVGYLFDDEYAQYCKLCGLLPNGVVEPREKQAGEVFEHMESVLHEGGMDFSNVIRTWFYNDKILDWYGDFNKVRDAFFTKKRVYEGLLPASTGVGGHNSAGTALASGLIAVKPKANDVRAFEVPSPLQNSATKYGSSFSRAVELDMPDHRRLFVSGTASIEPSGLTVHIDDPASQLKLTMEVVNAILESRGMSWSYVTRALAYFKRADDAWLFEQYRNGNHIPKFPVVVTQNDVCRDELLFEIEVDAICVKE